MTTELKVAILGEALIDFKATAPMAFQGYFGGSPYNVAIAVARMAQPVCFLSQISSDILGAPLLAYLKQNGVDTHYVLESAAPTTVAFVEEYGGNLHFQFIANGSADTLYNPQPRPTLPDSVQFVQFGSISLLQEPAATSITDIVAAHRARAIIVFDPNCRPALTPDRDAYRRKLQAWLRLAHIVKISEQDLAWLEPNRAHAETAHEWLANGVSAVIITRGGDGAWLYRAAHAPLHVMPPKITVADTVGAGDTFTAATMVGLIERGVSDLSKLDTLSSDDWQWVMQFAATAAAINCTRSGTNPPTRAEIKL
jgi:fructokinase